MRRPFTGWATLASAWRKASLFTGSGNSGGGGLASQVSRRPDLPPDQSCRAKSRSTSASMMREQTIKLRQGDLPGQLRHQVIFSPLCGIKETRFLRAGGQAGGLSVTTWKNIPATRVVSRSRAVGGRPVDDSRHSQGPGAQGPGGKIVFEIVQLRRGEQLQHRPGQGADQGWVWSRSIPGPSLAQFAIIESN